MDPAPLELSPAARQNAPLAEAMAMYQLSIEQLETALLERSDQLDPATMETIQSNLRAIDDAIFDSRQALSRDPESEYLNAHLSASIKRKVRLLRQANNLASNQI